MTYKNKEVAEEFANYGTDESIKAKHFYFEQDVLFSYGSHFPLCVRLKDGWIINKDGYSNTTARHKGCLVHSLGLNYKDILENCPKHIKLLTTQEIREFCFKHLNEKGLRFITFDELNKLKIVKNL